MGIIEERLEKRFDPRQPRGPDGRWIDTSFSPLTGYFGWTQHRNPSPRFKPKPRPRTKQQAWKRQPAVQVILKTDVIRRCKRMKKGDSTRFPEGVLLTKLSDHHAYQIDGPTGVLHVHSLDHAAQIVAEEETTARADRFGNSIPGNPMGPLVGVDVPPKDPVGDQIGGMLHGGYVTLPNGTKVHRKPGESGDEFEVISAGGLVQTYPATDKDATIAAARAAEEAAGPKERRDFGDRTPERNPDSVGPLKPLPKNYTRSRKIMHRISTQVMGVAQKPSNEIALYPTPGGFGTPNYVRRNRLVQIRTEGNELVREYGPRVDREEVPGVDRESAEALATMFDLADEMMKEFAQKHPNDNPTTPILWPEHFDIGMVAGHEEARANLGMSPGDEAHPEPYFYVGPWSAPEPSEIWNARGFNGAELTYAEVLAAPNQREAIRQFFASRFEALQEKNSLKKRSLRDAIAAAIQD